MVIRRLIAACLVAAAALAVPPIAKAQPSGPVGPGVSPSLTLCSTVVSLGGVTTNLSGCTFSGVTTIRGADTSGTTYNTLIYDSLNNNIVSINNQGRIDQYKFNDADGAIMVLGIKPTTPANGVRAGHYAFTALNGLSEQHTIGILQSIITDITNTSMDSSISLRYMDNVDGNPGGVYTYKQPNKEVLISSAGLSLPAIPLTSTGALAFASNGTTEGFRLDTSQRVLFGTTTSVIGPGSFARQYQFNATSGAQFNRWSADAFSPSVTFAKSRNATVGSHAVVQASDTLLQLIGSGSDGSAFISSGQITIQAEGTISSGVVPGRMILSVASAAGTMSDAMRLTSGRSVVLNNAALATNATDGFLYIASGPGAPSGTPTAFTGRVPLYYDSSNNQLYIYNSGWLQPKTPAAAAIVSWQ